MTLIHRAPWYAAALVVLGMLAGFDAARANHYILPCGDPCDPPTSLAYIGNIASNYATVIDTTTNTVIATVDVGQTTTGVAMSPDGRRVYMANGRSLVVVETATGEVVARVVYGTRGYNGAGVAVNAAGTRVYVTNGFDYSVAVFDTATNTLLDIMPTAHQGFGIATAPDDRRIYLTSPYGDTVSVLDVATGAPVAIIPIDNPYTVPPRYAGDFSAGPVGIAVNAAGTRAYVANRFLSDQAGGDFYMSVIDLATNAIVASVPTGRTPPSGIAIDPSGARIYLSNGAVIDAATHAVVATIPSASRGIALNASGTRIYALRESPPGLLVVDAETGAVVADIPLEGTPYALGQFVTPTTRDYPGR